MSQDALTLARLIGSRICHDIISPIGAISNGLELIALSGQADTPEMALIADSVEGANARIKFYRVALGLASSEQLIGPSEIRKLLKGFYAGSRISCDCDITRDLPRDEAQALLLGLMCLTSALPVGGELRIRPGQNGGWCLEAEAKQTRINSALWQMLDGASVPSGVQPSEVQFIMLPACAAALGRPCSYELGDTMIRITL